MCSATATATSPLSFQRSSALPRDCTFDSHDWEILSRYWHPAEFAAAVADRPVNVTLTVGCDCPSKAAVRETLDSVSSVCRTFRRCESMTSLDMNAGLCAARIHAAERRF